MKTIQLIAATGAAIALSAASQSIADEYQVSIVNLTPGMHFTPIIVAAHPPSTHMFSPGTAASAQLQAMAEGGNTRGLNTLLESVGANIAVGDSLLAPGASVAFTIESSTTNSVLSLAGMLLPTNDGFLGLNSVKLPDGPVGASMTYAAVGYDAGTEANDELVGSGAPGESGFPAPPPIVATGTGSNGTGIPGHIEGFVHVHKPLIGDLDPNGGVSDVNSAVHGWLNPVARITITKTRSDGPGETNGPSGVTELTGTAYSTTALEIFWQPATSNTTSIHGYEVQRNGNLVDTFDGLSLFETDLQADTEYTYTVTAIDGNGTSGPSRTVKIRTNAE